MADSVEVPVACPPQYAASMIARSLFIARIVSACPLACAALACASDSTLGYYRMPALHGDSVVFVAEGDLWRVDAKGGLAARITTHAGEERDPSISPDGTTLAFTASYEGPREVYTMPIDGGLPMRRTWDAARIGTTGWTPSGILLYATKAGTDLPSTRLWRHDLKTDARGPIPLAQCAEVAFFGESSIVFTRLAFQGSHTDRYTGGTAQQLWSFTLPIPDAQTLEAKPLTADYAGTSRRPLAWHDRVAFISDRSGRMNLWSMNRDATDLKQHTHHRDFDIANASIDGDRVVYQLGPDLWIHDLLRATDSKIDIHLASDFDQMRERWISDPAAQVSSAAISPDGDRVVFTIRGRVFVVPAKQGRTVDADRRSGIRYRSAEFMPDGAKITVISDESGELEIATLPANGVGAAERKTNDGQTVRWLAVASPDGTRIAHTDKRLRVWVLELATGVNTLVEENTVEQPTGLAWSHDSKWLAYNSPAANMNQVVRLWPITGGAPIAASTDRYDSYKPQWSVDGKFLYFLSDRTFESSTSSPWGPRAPEPFFAETGRIYQLALKADARSPFQPQDELHPSVKAAEKEKATEESATQTTEKAGEQATPATEVVIDIDGLSARIEQLLIKATNFGDGPLLVTESAIFWSSFDAITPTDDDDDSAKAGTVLALAIGSEKPEPKEIATGVRIAGMSADRKHLLLQKPPAKKGESPASWHIVDAKPEKAELDKPIDMSAIALAITPREEWREMMVDAWRLLRDYFYDRNMHGADWATVRTKYEPWIDRVRSREELSDVFQEMTGELSALHHFVYGGDLRDGTDKIAIATLGADLVRDEAAGGWRVSAIPASDPDEPTMRSPLTEPTVRVEVGDVVLAIDGTPTLSVAHPSMLLRNKAQRQTLLSVMAKGGSVAHDVIARPLSARADATLRYRSWEIARRARVETASANDIGYLHLRSMVNSDFSDFARDFYPVFNRKALIIDVRNNRGGNIDSWILSRLMRKAWMYWSQPVGRSPSWNMQYAFRGHMVVLCDADTASDGEAFSDGFRRLGLGMIIGTRTWGGEIWLSSSNTLADGGIATAGENGVFDASGAWLIEGHGVEPDIVVDNLPYATFQGQDAQLEAAIAHLQERIKAEPSEVPPVPAAPRKAVK